MDDINTQVCEYVEKNPENAIKQFHTYLDALKDKKESNNEIDFQQYDIDADEPDEEEYNMNQNVGRLGKYAM